MTVLSPHHLHCEKRTPQNRYCSVTPGFLVDRTLGPGLTFPSVLHLTTCDFSKTKSRAASIPHICMLQLFSVFPALDPIWPPWQLWHAFNWFFEDFWVSRVNLFKQNTLRLLLAHTLVVVGSWLRMRPPQDGERLGEGQRGRMRRGALMPSQQPTHLSVLQKKRFKVSPIPRRETTLTR